MALTFNTAALIAVVEGVQQAIVEADLKYQQDCAVARLQARIEWDKNNRARVRALRDYLTKSLGNKGFVPTTNKARELMGQESRYDDGVKLFHGRGDGNVTRTHIGYQRPDQLDGLAEILRAHQGDTITAGDLKQLGTHPRDLEILFRAASLSGAAVKK